jgi:hypothetical protein
VPQDSIKFIRAGDSPFRCLPVTGIDKERPGLIPSQPTVRSNQVLERRDFSGLRKVPTIDEKITDIGETIEPLQLLRRVILEITQRIDSIYGPSIKIVDPLSADDYRTELLRVDEYESDPRMVYDRRYEIWIIDTQVFKSEPL